MVQSIGFKTNGQFKIDAAADKKTEELAKAARERAEKEREERRIQEQRAEAKKQTEIRQQAADVKKSEAQRSTTVNREVTSTTAAYDVDGNNVLDDAEFKQFINGLGNFADPVAAAKTVFGSLIDSLIETNKALEKTHELLQKHNANIGQELSQQLELTA